VTRFLPLALLLACRGGPVEGTSVGNPTELAARLAPSSDLIIDSAQVALGVASFTNGQGGVEDVDLAATVDLLDGGSLEMPELEWVSLELFFASPIELHGSTSGDAEASVTIDAESLFLTSSADAVGFDGGAYVLELGIPGWLDADSIGYDPDEDLLVEPGSTEHDTLAGLVGHSSSLVEDQDGDGEVSDDERDAAVAGGDRGE